MTFDAFAAFRMTGHNVIITGGAQNIGAGIARTLSGAGAKVMIADLNGDMAKETAAAIAKDTGNDCRGITCDVTSLDDINAVVDATVKAFGGISTLVNNVGWGGRHEDPAAITEEAFIASYKLNTISAYRMSMACLPHLLKAKNATITNSGSMSSAAPAYDILAYGTAKAALNQMMVSDRPHAGQEGARQQRADRHGDDGGLWRCRHRSGDAGAAFAPGQSHRPPRKARGRRQRHAVAVLAGERLGERADHQCSWRRRRGAPVRQVRLMGRNAVRPALAVLAMAALAGGHALAQEASTHPSNLPQSMQAEGVPVESVSVQLRTSGGSPEQDAAALAAVRKLGAALEGEPFSAIETRRAVARMEREAGVRKVEYRLLPQGANAVRIQFLVDAAPAERRARGCHRASSRASSPISRCSTRMTAASSRPSLRAGLASTRTAMHGSEALSSS